MPRARSRRTIDRFIGLAGEISLDAPPWRTHVADMRALADDSVLATRIQAGDRSALDTLFVRYYSALLTYLTYQLGDEPAAEDVIQTIFLELWQRRADFRPAGGVRAYLFVAARHRMLNAARSSRRVARHVLTFSDGVTMSPVEAPDAALERRELETRVQDALDSLSPRGREAFALIREQGLSYQEAADVMGVSVNTIKTLLGRAVVVLRNVIGPLLALVASSGLR